MKIDEFSIRQYGPLPDTGKIKLKDGFNLFYGKNEDGKTLTIDALVKLLFSEKNERKHFEQIDRVEDKNPEGYVIINIKNDRIKLPSQGSLPEIAYLSAEECKNIFIIRNSNLSIANESNFYTNITEKLTGLRTTYIEMIKTKLKEMANITDTYEYRNKSPLYLKRKINEAKKIIEKIENLFPEIQKTKFDILELKSIEMKDKLENIHNKLEKIDGARKRVFYERGKKALRELFNAINEIKKLEFYNEEDRDKWRELKREIQRNTEEIKGKRIMLHRNEEEIETLESEKKKIEIDFKILEKKKSKVDIEIKPKIEKYKERRIIFASRMEKMKLLAYGWMISGLLTAISLLGIILRPSMIFYISTGIFFIPTLMLLLFNYIYLKDKSELTKEFENIRMMLSEFNLNPKNIEDVLANIQVFNDNFDKEKQRLDALKIDIQVKEEKNVSLRKEIQDLENKIKSAEEEIDRIKEKSGENLLEKYEKKIERKRTYEKIKSEKISNLYIMWEKDGGLDNQISYWKRKIAELERYKDVAKEIEFSNEIDVEGEKLKKEKEDIERQIEEINKKMEDMKENLKEICRETNEVLGKTNYCETSKDLEVIKEQLEEFIQKHENTKNNAMTAIKIFEEIKSEEKEKVAQLFGKDEPVSKYFEEITEGLYKEVNFNKDTGKIVVIQKNNISLEAEKLSGGAYDQLYLSIRLALGEKLLKDTKGFFIMDDPFIKADPVRIKTQFDTLRRIAQSGWQILYFSAKGEVMEVLKEDIKNGNINYLPVKGIFTKK